MAGTEFERLCRMGEGGKGHDAPNGARFLDCQLRTDLGAKRRIAANDRGSGAKGSEVVSEPLLELRAVGIA